MNVYYQMTKSCSLCKSQQRVFCLMPNKCPIIHLVQLHWMSLVFPKPFTLSQWVWEADKKDEPLWALGLLHWSLLYLSESWIYSLAERKQAWGRALEVLIWQWPHCKPLAIKMFLFSSITQSSGAQKTRKKWLPPELLWGIQDSTENLSQHLRVFYMLLNSQKLVLLFFPQQCLFLLHDITCLFRTSPPWWYRMGHKYTVLSSRELSCELGCRYFLSKE